MRNANLKEKYAELKLRLKIAYNMLCIKQHL